MWLARQSSYLLLRDFLVFFKRLPFQAKLPQVPKFVLGETFILAHLYVALAMCQA